jgi:hypothetical protein
MPTAPADKVEFPSLTLEYAPLRSHGGKGLGASHVSTYTNLVQVLGTIRGGYSPTLPDISC